MLLEVKDLSVHYHQASTGNPVHALDGVSLQIEPGEALGIVGETGSGKSTLALTLMGLVKNADIFGQVFFNGKALDLQDEKSLRAYRWRRIALAFQGAASAFDPVYKIGKQVIEPMLTHLGCTPKAAEERARDLLDQVGLPKSSFEVYPHQLSGGQNQRAMLAMALSCDPDLLILDEPTSGLDILSRGDIEELLLHLRRSRRMSMIVISHDLSDISRLTDRTAFLYAGQITECGETAHLLEDPRHPYSWGLVNAYPLITRTKDLWGIRGELPDPTDPPTGCRFHPRCTQGIPVCHQENPPLAPLSPQQDGRLVACHRGGLVTLLEVENLKKSFHIPHAPEIQAVRDGCLTIREGEVVGLVGQSGSGKTTFARLVIGLEAPDGGHVVFNGKEIVRNGIHLNLNGSSRSIQMIFQNPFESLSGRLTVLEIVREPLDIQQEGTLEERESRVKNVLSAVHLPAQPGFLARFTYELSGGQLQRLAIARALILEPKLILADEPVSMLDASEQAKVIQLLKALQNERGMAMLLISHDIALVRKVADRIAVMAAGEIVEQGASHRILTSPQHPYTRALIEKSMESEGMKEINHA